MSATESFAELTGRLRREREEKLARVKPTPEHFRIPRLPAPLRLPPGDPRRRRPLVPEKRSRNSTELPPPLFTGIRGMKLGGYQHPITSWEWDPELCEWIGFCPVCRSRFRADWETARKLDGEAALVP